MKTCPTSHALPHPRLALPFLLAMGLMACAATGPHSPSARPVIYTTSTPSAEAQARSHQETDACMARAQTAGLTPWVAWPPPLALWSPGAAWKG